MGVAALESKPIIIHTREAWDDTLDLLEEHWAPTGLGGVMHCFSGNLEQALASIEMGFHISFAGMLTFGRSDDLRQTAAALPLDRLLVETDSPYLTPAPYRKIRRNEPRFVVETARKLAETQGVEFERVCEATTANFYNLFKLQRPV
jgi:TatD DNase family protein